MQSKPNGQLPNIGLDEDARKYLLAPVSRRVSHKVKTITTMRSHIATAMPATPRAWLSEIADAYLDAYEAIPYGVVFGDTITENELFHMAPHICLKFRGIKRTKANIKKSTEAMLSSYIATQDRTPQILANPHIAFSFAYLACHFAIDLLSDNTVNETMNYIEEHQIELGKAIEERKKKLANQVL